MADLTAVEASQIAQKDLNRLVGSVAKALAFNSPFVNILQGGTFASGVSDTVQSAIQMQAAPGDSLAVPTFVPDTEVCNEVGTQELTDAINLSYRLESKRGYGPKVCVKQGFAAYATSYSAAEDSLKKLIVQYLNADTRAQLYLRSGSKFVARAETPFSTLFRGGTELDTGIGFDPAVIPDSPLTFKTLHYLARYAKEALLADMWPAEGKGQMHFKFIGSSDIIESFRAETGVKEVLLSNQSGSFKFGQEALTGYSWEYSPAYRGISLGCDQRPLRSNAVIESGDDVGKLELINPITIVQNLVKKTAYAKANTDWLNAEGELGFLIAYGTFERQVPERYVGEGSFKFAPQLHMGELEWFYSKDNLNPHGDTGQHIYQITRAYKPLRPHWVIPIWYRRPAEDLGLVATDEVNS